MSTVACDETTNGHESGPLRVHTPDHHGDTTHSKHPECMTLIQCSYFLILALVFYLSVDPKVCLGVRAVLGVPSLANPRGVLFPEAP